MKKDWVDELYPESTPFEKYLMRTYGESMDLVPEASHYVPANLVHKEDVHEVNFNTLRVQQLSGYIYKELEKAWNAAIAYANDIRNEETNSPSQRDACGSPKLVTGDS